MQITDGVVILNTVLLVIIFFYQKNRNRILLERINHQEKVIIETKGIVSQQSTAIDSQSKVVETAIKYSESFSPEKLEKIIRRELEIEYREEKEKIILEYQEAINNNEKKIKDLAVDISNSLWRSYTTPFLTALIQLLFTLSPNDRALRINKIENLEAKQMVLGIVCELEGDLEK